MGRRRAVVHRDRRAAHRRDGRPTAVSSASPTRAAGPNGATLGADGCALRHPERRDGRGAPGHGRHPAGDARRDGRRWSPREVAGITLDGPNDLAFGADGRLCFTDPRGASDRRATTNPGRLFALDLDDRRRRAGRSRWGRCSRTASASSPTARWRGPSRSPGGSWRWSTARPSRSSSCPTGTAPDGFCVGADGRLYVASTYAHCVSVIEDGEIVDELDVRRRHDHELLLRRHRPLRHRVPPRHALALRARRRRAAAAQLSRLSGQSDRRASAPVMAARRRGGRRAHP